MSVRAWSSRSHPIHRAVGSTSCAPAWANALDGPGDALLGAFREAADLGGDVGPQRSWQVVAHAVVTHERGARDLPGEREASARPHERVRQAMHDQRRDSQVAKL